MFHVSSESPKKSGKNLLMLLAQHLPEIRARESRNRHRIYLYNIGEYWVGFERSAYCLSRLYHRSSLNTMRFGQGSPLVIAGLAVEDSDSVLSNLVVESRSADSMVLLIDSLDPVAYVTWKSARIAEYESTFRE